MMVPPPPPPPPSPGEESLGGGEGSLGAGEDVLGAGDESPAGGDVSLAGEGALGSDDPRGERRLGTGLTRSSPFTPIASDGSRAGGPVSGLASPVVALPIANATPNAATATASAITRREGVMITSRHPWEEPISLAARSDYAQTNIAGPQCHPSVSLLTMRPGASCIARPNSGRSASEGALGRIHAMPPRAPDPSRRTER